MRALQDRRRPGSVLALGRGQPLLPELGGDAGGMGQRRHRDLRSFGSGRRVPDRPAPAFTHPDGGGRKVSHSLVHEVAALRHTEEWLLADLGIETCFRLDVTTGTPFSTGWVVFETRQRYVRTEGFCQGERRGLLSVSDAVSLSYGNQRPGATCGR